MLACVSSLVEGSYCSLESFIIFAAAVSTWRWDIKSMRHERRIILYVDLDGMCCDSVTAVHRVESTADHRRLGWILCLRVQVRFQQ